MKPTLQELRETAQEGPPYDEAFLEMLRRDSRAGARLLYGVCLRKNLLSSAEADRMTAMLRFEQEAEAAGFRRIAGVDEAGRGPIAGPIAAAAVILGEPVPGLNDSKQLTVEQREALFAELHNGKHTVSKATIPADQVDHWGIQSSNYGAMARAVALLEPPADFLLVDGFAIPGCSVPQKHIVKGDCLSQSIAAASIVAKVVRDRIMSELDRRYPQYGFCRHKGYATEEHLEAIRRHGPCPEHRMSFAPFAHALETQSLFTKTECKERRV